MNEKANNKKMVASLALFIAIMFTGMLACNKNGSSPANYAQTNLVADTAGFAAARIDTNLDNPWGIAISSSGTFWLAVNHSDLSEIYDNNGNQVLAPITIGDGLSPDGAVFNSTSSFIIPKTGQVAKFIFVTEDGIMAAWSSGDSTMTVADRSASGTVYKGLAIANDGTGDFVYAADFHNAKIDVFDKSFNYTPISFSDPNIPVGFAPFNIANIGGQLYVTYAMQKAPDAHDDQAGPGNGFVDVFSPTGAFVKRFASHGTLNSPWGIVQAPPGFGQGANSILVSNFGDGRINVFDAAGNFKSQLQAGGTPISIDGLWAIAFLQPGMGSGDPNKLYFTAGPQAETFGIFGYLQRK